MEYTKKRPNEFIFETCQTYFVIPYKFLQKSMCENQKKKTNGIHAVRFSNIERTNTLTNLTIRMSCFQKNLLTHVHSFRMYNIHMCGVSKY